MNITDATEARWTANQTARYLDAQEALAEHAEKWDEEYPDWRDREAGEDARYVGESDVDDPEQPVFHGRFGSNDHGKWS